MAKKTIDKFMATDDYKKAHDEAIEWSHKFIDIAGPDTSPLVMTLFLSHTLSHVLMGAPDEDKLRSMFAVFMSDLDIQRIIEEWAKRQQEDEEHEEAEVSTIH